MGIQGYMVIGIIVLTGAAFFLYKGTGAVYTNTTIPSITNGELKHMLDAREDFILLDVREVSEYGAGHIPGARLVPLGMIGQLYGELNKGAKIVVLCRTGNRSMKAARMLQENGFINIVNVNGGMGTWPYPVER